VTSFRSNNIHSSLMNEREMEYTNFMVL